MIKGVLAIFRSGLIFDPFVFLGIVSGIFFVMAPNKEMVEALLKNNDFYLLVLLLGLIYNFLLKREYKDDGETINYALVIFRSVMSLVKYVISCAGAMMFVLLLLSF